MTYFITALTNDKARLVVSETRTDDEGIAHLVGLDYEARAAIAAAKGGV